MTQQFGVPGPGGTPDEAGAAAAAAQARAEAAEARAAAAQAVAEAAEARAVALEAKAAAAAAGGGAGPTAAPATTASEIAGTPASASVPVAVAPSQWSETVRAAYAFADGSLPLGALVEDGTASPDAQVGLPLAMMNRHGLVAGATGTGKTKTLQVMTEGLSSAGRGRSGQRVRTSRNSMEPAGSTVTKPRSGAANP
ncbi:helicase HerA-like domain-containing protein [Cellulomonas sp. KRMCY2]|uniref:helicase HerA-like domain-containing protein n=1 Tax=Cellulomonas sp. KRMCY2 TaxID=1304865 RepID=UPI00068713C3|nr:helicase HerA-like domain-containing protein [Cellulomonas sp. KRMCY2]